MKEDVESVCIGKAASVRVVAVAWAIALVACSVGCASSTVAGGHPVPKPFPMPRSSGPAGVAGAPAEPAPAAASPASPDPLVVAEPAATTVPVSPVITRAPDFYALVGTALDLRGAPYRDGGTDPRGFDCSGFTQYVYRQYGLTLPRAVRDQFKLGSAVPGGNVVPGDLLFFTTTEPGASHVGIAVGTDQFIHAPSSTGVVRVERLSSSYWSQRFIGAKRLDARIP
jgi:cell wall-associated NlpC family hydrolase